MDEERIKAEAAAKEAIMSLHHQLVGIVSEMEQDGFGHMTVQHIEELTEGLQEARRMIGSEWLAYLMDRDFRRA